MWIGNLNYLNILLTAKYLWEGGIAKPHIGPRWEILSQVDLAEILTCSKLALNFKRFLFSIGGHPTIKIVTRGAHIFFIGDIRDFSVKIIFTCFIREKV
jgi:hypothetical protein